jgi:hypothetical protein
MFTHVDADLKEFTCAGGAIFGVALATGTITCTDNPRACAAEACTYPGECDRGMCIDGSCGGDPCAPVPGKTLEVVVDHPLLPADEALLTTTTVNVNARPK